MTALGACQDSGSSTCLTMFPRYNCSMSITCPTNWLLRPIRNGSGWTQKSTRTRTYDNKGRLVETREGNSMLASYTYSANGNVVSKHYYDAGTEVFAKTVRRTIL